MLLLDTKMLLIKTKPIFFGKICKIELNLIIPKIFP